MGLEPNRPVFAEPTRTAGGLPGPLANTNIKSLWVYPPIRVFMAVGFIWASRWCYRLHSEIERHFRVGLVFAVVCDLGDELSLGGELSVLSFSCS